jgi:orotate phosphoribosyltransferase
MLRLGQFYAEAIKNSIGLDFDVLFGPAYKGIPLAVTTSVALYDKFQKNSSICFNRKEAKDHGEGGSLIGRALQNGDKVLIIEDVTTAGTSVRESIPLLKSFAPISVIGLIVSVDRMEKGTGTVSALQELREAFSIATAAIVTLEEIISYLYNKPVLGKVHIDGAMMKSIEAYRKQYGA